MFSKFTKEKIILLIAVAVGLIAVLIYLFSGQSSFDLRTRDLKNSDNKVEDVIVQTEPDGQKNLQVKCENGSSYDVYYPPGETNYDALAASKC